MSKHWTEQYRPRNLDSILGQQTIRKFLQRVTTTSEIAPHLIIHGPPGTGKTTLALAFASDLYPGIPISCALLYLNASDERTIETIRGRVREFIMVKWVGVQRKIIVFDEIETMTEPAQITLKAFMDIPFGKHAPLFIFLCNTISRIIPSIRSRALTFFCTNLESTHIQQLIMDIQTREHRKTPLPTRLACILSRSDLRSFIQTAQVDEDPNIWVLWFQRLLNASVEYRINIWEYGIRRLPLAILLRQVLLLCFALGIPSAVGNSVWVPFLEAVIRSRSRNYLPEFLQNEWENVVRALA